MKTAKAYRHLFQQITGIYEEREARNIARIVFEDAFGIHNLNGEDLFPADLTKQLQVIAQRLLKGEPLQYILGQADFYGLKFFVTPDTLIPRAETEELVYEILQEHVAGTARSVLDIGTGTGCIPLVLKQERPQWAVTGVDVSPDALKVAHRNAAHLGLSADFQLANILEEAAWATLSTYDIVVSNPPYIPPSEARLMPEHVLQHEPHLALFTDTEDALVFYRAIARLARQRLAPGGKLYFELNEFNGYEVLSLVESEDFKDVELRKDMSGKIRILSARQPDQ
ncbi:MAG: peptide chain release factor N(5)-glutamine methyltransferase [Phaeodactylibacter sp.]|uniref:peptide chain release factor N(5)-glutamine methyltransferase n=1 Tax=Phaeodactylibacter sp. TaxID=1940289 RepID=UPI0032EDBC32